MSRLGSLMSQHLTRRCALPVSNKTEEHLRDLLRQGWKSADVITSVGSLRGLKSVEILYHMLTTGL